MTAWAALREDRKRTPEQRARIVAHLAAYPGLTAGEIHRAALPDIHPASVRYLVIRMALDGQLTGDTRHDDQQGRPVTRWYAIPEAEPS
jgi:hypothetical protein